MKSSNPNEEVPLDCGFAGIKTRGKKKKNGNWVPEVKGEEKKMIKDGGSGYLAGLEREERKVIERESRRSIRFRILDESESLKSN